MANDQQLDDQLKAAAAESAVAQVQDGMTLGLGTGTTAAFVLNALGRRVRDGLHVVGVPSSERTAARAKELGIPLAELDGSRQLDVTIDGADVVDESNLALIKGRGGALLREKLVACASRQMIVVVHASKVVAHLSVSEPIPVEVVPFGWQVTARRLADLGARPVLRAAPDGKAFVTDGGHYILDCAFAPERPAEELARQLDGVVGVVEHGLFIGIATEVHVASVDGIRVLRLR